jgi:signal transduction histidine kinase
MRLLGRTSKELGLEFVFEGEAQRSVEIPARQGHWELARSPFRLEGRPHTLVMISDVSRPRREEERAAWQKLVRVLGHEIGNSLGPIQSVATLLREGLEKPTPPAGWADDAKSGLALISRRAEALARFTAAYARLARLPPPELGLVEVGPWATRVAELVGGATVEAGPEVQAVGDEAQLDQLLINLVRNGVEAARETGGSVKLSWGLVRRGVEIRVDDEGPGLPPSANLFVPFFTTKAEGNGIGLLLARQIAEAHGGSVTLANRLDRTGCRATIVLPVGLED